MQKIGRIDLKKCIYFHCDVQTFFKPLIYNYDSVQLVSQKTLQACNVLQIPVIISEHQKKTFGETVPEIQKYYPKQELFIFQKTKFSMLNEEILELMKEKERREVILSGIEGHICVQQTCLDLLEKGFDVHLLIDGISSQTAQDRKVSLKRMKKSGAFLTTFEGAIFEILRDSTHPYFKQILPILKQKL